MLVILMLSRVTLYEQGVASSKKEDPWRHGCPMDDHRWLDGSGYQIGRCASNTEEPGENKEQRISEERARDLADE